MNHQIPSQFLAGHREVNIHLPAGYHEDPDRRYPVLYLHDGQNLFDPATAFCNQDWGLGRTLDELVGQGLVEPTIVIGIHNAGESRMHEYTHVKNRRGVGGGARRYLRFVIDELKPFIDREYRTRPDAQNTGLGGSSLGGLVTLYMGLRYPQVFGNLVVMSPSIWWASKAILRHARKREGTLGQRIWLDIGSDEGAEPETCIANVRELRDILLARGWHLGHDLYYVEDEGAGHNECAWGARMRQALPFLFPADPVLRSETAERTVSLFR